MRSLFLLVLALGNVVEATRFLGIKHTRNSRAVHDYLDQLVPASKNALLHELMGPKVGADVSSYTQSSDLHDLSVII